MALRAHKRVLSVRLPFNGDVPIQIVTFPIGWPAGLEARSTPNRVLIAERAIRRGPPGRPEYLLYEEIAHHIALDAGLPHGGHAGIFLQELLAGYVKFELALKHDPEMLGDVTLPEISGSDWQLFYGFGTDLGAELAGISMVTPVIERLLRDTKTPRVVREKGSEVRDELAASDFSAPELLDRCGRRHTESAETLRHPSGLHIDRYRAQDSRLNWGPRSVVSSFIEMHRFPSRNCMPGCHVTASVAAPGNVRRQSA